MLKIRFLTLLFTIILWSSSCRPQSSQSPTDLPDTQLVSVTPTIFTTATSTTTTPRPTTTLITTLPQLMPLRQILRAKLVSSLAVTEDGKNILFNGIHDNLSGLLSYNLINQKINFISTYVSSSPIDFSPSGIYAAIGGEASKIIETSTWKLVLDGEAGNEDCILHFTDDETILRACSALTKDPASSRIDIWDWVKHKTRELARYQGIVRAVDYEESSGLYAVAFGHTDDIQEDKIVVWEWKTSTLLCEIPGYYALFQPNTNNLVVFDEKGNANTWIVKQCKPSDPIPTNGDSLAPLASAFSSNGQYLTVTTNGKNNSIIVIDINRDVIAYTTKVQNQIVTHVTAVPQSKSFLLSALSDNSEFEVFQLDLP